MKRNIRFHTRCSIVTDFGEDQSWALLNGAAEQFGLSARVHQRGLRMARMIADLAGAKRITPPHVAEALSLRCLVRRR
jgi:magnesium chelatase family protein